MARNFNRATVAAHAAPVEALLFREEIKPTITGVTAFSVRKDASADEVLKTLHDACGAYKAGSVIIQQLKLVIGKTLAVVRDRKLFGAHRTFEAFIKAEVVDRYNIGRSTAWEAIKVAQAFPSVDSEGYQQIGAAKLISAARVAGKLKPEQLPALDVLLHEKKPLADFQQGLQELLGAGTGAKPEVAQLVFRVPVGLASEWRRWCELPEVKALAGGDDATTDAFFALAFRLAMPQVRAAARRAAAAPRPTPTVETAHGAQ